MRIANVIMLVVFLMSCAVQYNDPDPALWIFYYGVAAVFTTLAIAKSYTWWTAVAALGYLVGFAYYIPAWTVETVKLLKESKMSSLDVELARESFGLLMCAVWMIVLTVLRFRGRGKPSEETATPQE